MKHRFYIYICHGELFGCMAKYIRGDHDHPTIVLEAGTLYNMWIWHSFFGDAGSSNDFKVLN